MSLPEGPRKGLGQNIEIPVRRGADPDMLVKARRGRFTYKDPLVPQPFEDAHSQGSIAATVDGDEIGCRGQGDQPVIAGDLCDAGSRGSPAFSNKRSNAASVATHVP